MSKKTETVAEVVGVDEPTAPTGEAAEAPAPTATDVVVDAWFVEQYHNRGHTVEEYNRVRAAIAALKARLNAIISR